ncbi:PAS domain-containing protein [Erythrobacter sp. THAF29]|uniref:PAS domain-containing protein n=1 Tax=Erythrobacter sp. THAF29 TaxID=2587851 RepID=UPI0012685B4D|nr:PAS domain-containing protein [Erythrobacter sp. THAF29]QFT77216.1 Blue-light-activated histidine kinase 2 [Erythrobacter sp. THAF29]
MGSVQSDKSFLGKDGPARDLLTKLPLSLVISDPHQDDCPVVYVNRAFEIVTGYSAAAAVGQNCRFLQGDDKDQPAARQIAEAISRRESISVDIRIYRANGEPFMNRLMIAPIFDGDGELFAFMGVQAELGERNEAKGVPASDATDILRETQHRVKNHLAMVVSLIRLESRTFDANDPARGFDVLARRVEALSLLYDEFTHDNVPAGSRYDVVSAGAYCSRVASTIGALDGRAGIRLNIDTDTVPMRASDAANVGLIVSEVLSHVFQHAFEDRGEGLIEMRLKSGGAERIRLTIADDGKGLGDSNWPHNGNLGARLVKSIVGSLGAEMEVTSNGGGTSLRLDLPYSMPTLIDGEGTRASIDQQGKEGAR